MSGFRLSLPSSDSDINDIALKHYYKSWRTVNQTTKSSFIALDNAFRDTYLKDLEPGPLKLYLYFCFAANNDHGHSWHGIQKIADYFDCQTRTIDNWIKVLVDKDLVYRTKKGHRSHTTYLLPFSDTILIQKASKKYIKDDQDLLNGLLKRIRELDFIYGEIIKVHHLFQWSVSKEKTVDGDKSDQYLLVITKRKNGVLIGHVYVLRKSDHLSVNELQIEEPSVFDSPFYLNESRIIGLALPHYPKIFSKSGLNDLLGLIRDLVIIEDWQLEDRSKLIYGEKRDLIQIEEMDNQSQVDEDSEDKNE
ncbi:hypothetical protein [Bacillus subtilis]|uniref:Helix-turn-helix domain-containing protein n=1 Tax=Bacillus subtilis TaxID=1423 RepID=Q45454_BACIU|nr:hypothetical protein [Bacillus subtilis]AAC44422.1 unknown [Bacillus subtilis]MEC0367961.1 hypothetical protein [Bacillus subtilis]MEC0392442.1 hypothetical protein [Bacillus subtilis]MEC0402180.1 hypothetical protein [Bacillus subtilis]POD82709.1 hypothetical protein S101384_04341 [Bacillus subtilis subsp. subtilis]